MRLLHLGNHNNITNQKTNNSVIGCERGGVVRRREEHDSLIGQNTVLHISEYVVSKIEARWELNQQRDCACAQVCRVLTDGGGCCGAGLD